MTQNTTDATNRLVINAQLVLGSAATPLVQSLGEGVGLDRIVIDINELLLLSGTGPTLTNIATMNINALTADSTGGTIAQNQVNAGTTMTVNNNGGILNLSGVASANAGGGAMIGARGTINRQYDILLTNSGTVNVAGRATVGTNNTQGSSNAHATVQNLANGQINIGDASTLQVEARSVGANHRTMTVTNAATGTINVGAADNTAGQGILQLRHANNGAITGTFAPATPSVQNSGTMNIRGNSVVELAASATEFTHFNFTNNASGVVNFNNTSTIGNTSKGTVFSNAGIFNKTGTGTASILSDATGSASNTGTMNIQAGTLLVSRPLTNSGIISGAGTLQTSGLTSTDGEFRPGNSIGTLTLALTNTSDEIDFLSSTNFVFELGSGNQSDQIAFTGLLANSADSTANVTFDGNTIDFLDAQLGLFTLFSFDQVNAYTGTLQIGTGLEGFAGSQLIFNSDNIQLEVVPEPNAILLLAAAAGLLALRRKSLA